MAYGWPKLGWTLVGTNKNWALQLEGQLFEVSNSSPQRSALWRPWASESSLELGMENVETTMPEQLVAVVTKNKSVDLILQNMAMNKLSIYIYLYMYMLIVISVTVPVPTTMPLANNQIHFIQTTCVVGIYSGSWYTLSFVHPKKSSQMGIRSFLPWKEFPSKLDATKNRMLLF